MIQHSPLTESDLSTLLKETFLLSVVHLNETDSTNSKAMALLASDERLETPHLVYAESQTSGRGRGSKQWWSVPGSLTFSVIVDCAQLGLSTQQQPQLPLLTGVALLRTGQAFLDQGDFSLKWPNDVYLAGRKLAGILTEVPSMQPRHAVIGVGLNVNNQFANAPTELQAIGISLSDVSGQTHDRLEILATFLQHLDTLIASLAQGAPVLDEWSSYCLLTGKQVTLEVGNAEISGLCRGIDNTGALLLATNQGSQRFLGGKVKSWN